MSLSNEKLKEIAKRYYFDIDDEFIKYVYPELETFVNNLEKFNNINLDNVKATHYCVDRSFNLLRKDEPEVISDSTEITKNAHSKLDKYIVVK